MVVAASVNSVVINNLVSGATYRFEVVARVTFGEKSVSGPRPNPLTLTVDSAVTTAATNGGFSTQSSIGISELAFF